MAISSRFSFSYQKLRKLATATEQHEEEEEEDHVHALQQSVRFQELSVAAAATKSWLRLRRRRPWRRPRVRVRMAAGFGRLVRGKAWVVRSAVRKVVNRTKEGSPYIIGELLAGNYMFMQVSPSPGPTVPVKPFLTPAAAGPHFYSSAMVPAKGSLLSLDADLV